MIAVCCSVAGAALMLSRSHYTYAKETTCNNQRITRPKRGLSEDEDALDQYMDLWNKRWEKEKEFEKRLLIKILEFIHLGYNNEEEVGLKVMELFNECVGIEELRRLTKPDGMLDALVNIKLMTIDYEKLDVKLKKKDIKRIKCVINSAINILCNRPNEKKEQ